MSEFWDGLNTAPSTPSALPRGGAGATSSFWDLPQTAQSGQTAPVQTPQGQGSESEVPDSPGNPIAFIAGMAKNVVMDIPEVLKGLWTVGTATGEDVLGAVQQVVPGQQALETKIEEEGYNWGNIARATVGWGDQPSMVLDDYKSRYGFNGLDEFRDNVYSNPLSYILDALAVAGGVSVAAKTGAKLGMISEGTATAIRGISPSVAKAGRATGFWKPVTEVMGLRGAMGKTPVDTFASTVTPVAGSGAAAPGVMGISTSVNPLKRVISNFTIERLLTRSADDVKTMMDNGQWQKLGISPENSILTGSGVPEGVPGQALERVTTAAEQGMRIMKPTPEKFIHSRAARWISGVAKADFYGKRNAMIQSLATILDPEGKMRKAGQDIGQDVELVKDIMGTDDYLLGLLRGEKMPPKAFPNGDPIDFEDGTLPNFGDADIPTVGIEPGRYVQTMEAVHKFFNQTAEVTPTRFNTPHSKVMDGTTMRYTGLVGDPKDIPNVARQLGEQNGWQLLGLRNHMSDAESNWNGMHYFYDTGDGQIAEVNIATQELYDTQRLVSVIRQHVEDTSGVEASFNAEAQMLKELTGDATAMEIRNTMGMAEEDLKALARLEQLDKLTANLKDNYDAANLWMQRLWNYPMRKANAGGDYFPDMPNVMRVDQLFNWSTEWNVLPGMIKTWNKDWMKGITKANGEIELLRGPMTTALNRAFMPQKLEALRHITEWARDQVEDTIRANLNTAKATGTDYSVTDTVDNIAEILEDIHQIPRDQIRLALMIPTDADVARALWGRSIAGGDIMNPDAAATVRQMAQDMSPGEAMRPGRYAREWRPRSLPRDPKKAADVVVARLMEQMRMPILKGEIDGAALDAWGWRNFAESMPQIPGYYPHIRASQNSALWWKGAAMKSPQMAFNKGFKGYLMDTGRVQMDPYKAYSFRAYQILRHQELMDQFENLRPMARELTQQELMLIQQGAMSLEGQVLFSPDWAKKQLSLHSALLDDTHDAFNDGMLYEDAARNALQGINDELQNISTDALAGAKVYVLPKYVADQFKTGFLQGFSPGNMRLFWDKPRDMWISTTLGMNPRWFIYRAMGNIFFTGIGAGARDIVRTFGWGRAKNNDLIEMLLQSSKMPDGSSVLDATSRGYAAGEIQKLGWVNNRVRKGKMGTPAGAARLREWGSAKDEWPALTRMADWVYNRRIFNLPKAIVSRTTRRVNLMEQAERRGIALGAYGKAIGSKWESNINLARRIAEGGIDEDLAYRMQTEANWILGNYTNLSPLERDVVRRFLMPFYPFYRHMVKFATRMPWDHPVKSQVLRLLAEVDEDMGPHLPEYLGGGIYIGDIGGTPNYWNTTHWNPMAELIHGAGPVSGLDFRLRSLYSALSGTDPFNRPYHAHNVYTAPNGVEMIRTSTGWQRFEGIQHEPWLSMLMNYYSGPGSQAIAASTRGWGMSPAKFVAGNLGVTLSPYDVAEQNLRDLEAQMAALSSSTANEVPISWGE